MMRTDFNQMCADIDGGLSELAPALFRSSGRCYKIGFLHRSLTQPVQTQQALSPMIDPILGVSAEYAA